MTKKWEVTVNGTNNVIEYKAGFGAKILVNGQAYKVKSQNWWVMMVDYPIMIDDTEIRVVAIGNKVDLAVNGVSSLRMVGFTDRSFIWNSLCKTGTGR